MLIVSLSINSVFLFSQTPDIKRDFQWLIGYKDSVEKTVINLLEFNETPELIKPFNVIEGSLPFRSVSVICDTSGQILLYTNGCNVLNRESLTIANGGHITPDNWLYETYCPNYYPFTDSWLLLPDPAKDSLFYLFAIGHRQNSGAGIHAWGLYMSRLSEQEVFEKNTLICYDSIFGGHLTACRHANGRDWWLVLNKIKTNQYYKYLLDPTGVHFSDLQAIGLPTTWNGSGSGQSAFSPNGTKFIHYDNVTDMYVYNFDRCSGALSDFNHVNIQNNEDTGNSFGGMAISPNSRFAYTFGYLYSYQVDLQAADLQASVTQVAYWDGTYVLIWKTTFGKAALAPNGKIYSAVPGSNPYIHIVNNPNFKGDSCQFEQHGLFLPYSWNTEKMPNFPNFRLGRMIGSACDTVYTGVKEAVSREKEIQILPNPNNGTFHIQFPSSNVADWNLEIFDLNGRRRWQSTSSGNDTHVSYLPSGFYFLVCIDVQGGRRTIQRLIIQD